MIAWVALAFLIAAIAFTAWALTKASKAGTGILLAATAGFLVLWLFGLVNLFSLASQ